MHTQLATGDDKAAMIALGARADTEARHNRSPPHLGKVERMFGHTQAANGLIFGIVLIDEGVMIGMVIGLVTEHFFADMIYAANLVLYVVPEKRGGRGAVKLIRHFERECIARGANEILIGSTSNVQPARTMELYHALGYQPIGANAVKYLGE